MRERRHFLNIFGKQIVLRAISSEDVELLLDLINDPETEKMLGGSSFPVSKADQIRWIDSQIGRTDVLRCIVAQNVEEKIGLGAVILSDINYRNGSAQVHIKMDKEKGRGQGYGTDALNTIVGYAFKELRLNCLYAEVLEYNKISQSLFEKCGFKREGILRSRVFKDGAYVDVVMYSILVKDLIDG